ncbi:MAG: STAS domain-containing protein [Clostridiales Family XIII bacterium]|jgi:anti-anti-sigma factor|nr:STAS domain-containing protein [Clostridiales Family XIII bacterium]
MDINVTTNGGERVLALNGRLDTLTSSELQSPLTEAVETCERTVLDFEELEYISSAGLRVLLLAEKAAKAAGSEFVVRNVSDEILEIFEMTGFSDILKIE